LVSANQRLFLVGGFNGSLGNTWVMRNSVHELVDNQWTLIGELPKAQAEGVLSTAPDGAIHLVTGQSPIDKPNSQRSDHHAVATHLRWQPEDNQWQPMPDIPTPRNSATGGWVDDQLVVAGGRTRHGNLTTTEIFDLGTKMWRSGAPMPLPQAGTASVVVNDGLIVFGGEIFVPNAAVFPNVWHYSVSKNRWRAMADLPTPRHGLGAGLINGKAFVIGGATKPGGSGTSAINEVFSIS
jgi:N-acetylneuraminic acid mutarotase